MKKHLTYKFLHLPWPRINMHKPPQTFRLILAVEGNENSLSGVWRELLCEPSYQLPQFVPTVLSAMTFTAWAGQATPGTKKMQQPQHLSYSLGCAARHSCEHTVLTTKPTQKNSKKSAGTNPRANPGCFMYDSVHISATRKP